MHAAEVFERTYKKPPQHTAFTSYRVCPIGAHSDHQLGKITGFAIDEGIHIAYGPKENGVIEIQSLQFPKRAQWHVEATPKTKGNDWADHLRGATIALYKRYPPRRAAILPGCVPRHRSMLWKCPAAAMISAIWKAMRRHRRPIKGQPGNNPQEVREHG